MARRYEPGEILTILAEVQRQVDLGLTLGNACDYTGIASPSFYTWRKRQQEGEFDEVTPLPVDFDQLKSSFDDQRAKTEANKANRKKPGPKPRVQSPSGDGTKSAADVKDLRKENELLRRLVIDKEIKILALRDLIKGEA